MAPFAGPFLFPKKTWTALSGYTIDRCPVQYDASPHERRNAVAFSSLTLARYSCRSYQHRPVEDEKLQQILEAGRLAPSACNNHPTRVIVCDTDDLKQKAAKAAHHFAKDGSVFGAPVVLLVCAKTQDAWTRKYDDMNASHIDSSIVTDQMMMQAVDLGMQTCWVCHFDPRIATSEFDLPKGVYPIHMLTLGYPADAIADEEKRAARTISCSDFLNVNA